MNSYEKNDIEKMMASIATTHHISNMLHDANLKPYLGFKVEPYSMMAKKIKNIFSINIAKNFDPNNFYIKPTSFGDKVILHRNKLFTELISFLKNSDIAVPDASFPEQNINFIQTGISEYLNIKYKINITPEQFEQIIHSNQNKLSQQDLILAKKAIFIKTLNNCLDLKAFRNILMQASAMKHNWEEVINLPETYTHNDVHPMNFILSEDGKKVNVIDFSKSGINKRISDLSFVIISNNEPEEVIKALINGYRLQGNGHISNKEIEHLYDLWKAITITTILRELEDIEYIISTGNYSLVRTATNFTVYSAKLDKLTVQSPNNRVPQIFEETQNELLDGLSLENNQDYRFSYRNIHKSNPNSSSHIL